MNDTTHGYIRQTIAALVALSLVLSVFGPVGLVAADPSVSIEQTADSTTVAPGDTVTLTTEFDVAELNAPQLSVTLPDGWEITAQSADGPAAFNDGTWTWLAGDEDGVDVSYTVEYTVSVPDDASGEYAITADGSALSPADSTQTADSDSTTITVQEPDPNEGPSASFTSSPSSPEAGETVSFDASGSSDADGSIASYEWEFDGDGETDATGDQATTAFDAAGDYDVTLTVTDDDGATDTATETVSVADVPNQPPTADAGDDQTVEEGDSVTLDATESSDTDGDDLSYDWTQTGGAGVTLSDDDTATPSFTAPDVGADETLTFEVTVSDGESTDTDTAAVTVEDADEAEPPANDSDDGTPASTEVSLSPESDLVAVGDSAEYDIVVSDADGGVGVYSMTVAVDDPSVASITNVSLAGVGDELTDVQIAEDGTSATVEAVLVDTADEGAVTLGTVTVESAAEGTAAVSLDVSELGDESGNPYDVTATSGATLEASTLVVGNSDAPAQDPDGDGVYEDVNGDGSVDVLDVQTLFADRDGSVVQNSPEAFDFNGDGTFSLLDIQTLFAEETG
jgi:PKD repeat protein